MEVSWVQIGNDIDGENIDDRSGQSVSISADGSRIAIGAGYNDGNGNNSGHVRVWDFNGIDWVQVGQDIDGEADSDVSGWSVSISADGGRVAIGAVRNSGNGTNNGHVRVWDFNGTSWVQIGNNIDGESSYDQGGYSVSMSATGNRVAISATLNDGNGTSSGHVRIWEFNGTDWIQIGADIDGESAYDVSGQSVSLSDDGNRVAIGANLNDDNGIYSGHVRVWEFNGTSWIQIGNDIDGESDGDSSGFSVAFSSDGNRVAIGATSNSSNGNGSGHVRIWDFNGTDWAQIGNDIDGEGINDQSGRSVSISSDGNRVAIGAILNDDNGVNSGHVRIWEFNGSEWVQIGNDIDGESASDNSGNSVSMSADGNRVVIGANRNGGNGSDSGHVRVWELTENPMIQCQDVTINLDATGQVTIDYTDVVQTVTGGTEPFVYLVSQTLFDCTDLGNVTVDVLVTDDNSQTSSCMALVTIVDPIPPEITVPTGITIECGDSTDPISTGTAIATDNCTVSSLTFSDVTVSGVCPVVYTINRTWLATDSSGNTASDSQIIEVQDTLAPTAPSAPVDVTYECVSQIPTADSLTATDACEGAISVTGSDNILNPGNCPLFIQRTWTFIDTCNNSSGATQNITIIDTTPPVLGTPPPDQTFTFNEPCPATQLAWTDNCDGTGLVSSEDTLQQVLPGNIYIFERTWTYTDLCGNSVQAGPQLLTKLPKPRESFNFGSGRTYVYC